MQRGRRTALSCLTAVLILTLLLRYGRWTGRRTTSPDSGQQSHVPGQQSHVPGQQGRVSGAVLLPPGNVLTGQLPAQKHRVVPNVVHYVWFGDHEPLKFHHLLSVLSAYRFIRPERLYLHCDHPPVGSRWRQLLRLVPALRVRQRQPPATVFGNEVIRVEHKSDIVRMDILREEGGIYLDFDVIVLKPFDPLRYYNFTMGLEYHGNPGRLNNGVILAHRDSRFLRLWHDTYRNFTKREWDYHDSQIPYYMLYHYPELIHVEEDTINYPSGRPEGLRRIYDEVYDWSRNYAIHLWHRLHDRDHNPEDIKLMNTTFGQIARLIYYNTTAVIR